MSEASTLKRQPKKRQPNRLSTLTVARTKKPGMHPDGLGLYLRIAEDGGRGWVYRFTINGRTRYMGLGSAAKVTLNQARQGASEARSMVARGIDPIEVRDAAAAAGKAEQARSMTFKAAAEAYIESHKAGWRNAKHGDQWENTLKAYAYPVVESLPVQDIDVAHVTKILTPIWASKTETAGRVRGRIESVLDWATARGYRKGENPARWRGHLDKLLPKRSKVRRVKHHPALPYSQIGAFMVDLRKQGGLSAKALELLILTATRTSEAIGARWEEFDLKAKVWVIPPERIKAGEEHRIPLSAPAVATLKELAGLREKLPNGEPCPWVFPGVKAKSLSNNAILALLKRMGRDGITAHGFRSTFRDWAAEQTSFPREVAEMALAHVIDDKVEAAYRRGDLFEKRKRLMDAWAGYCATVQSDRGKVVPMHKKNKATA